MATQQARGGQSGAAAWRDWGLLVAAVALDMMSTFMPRADKAGTLRGDLRSAHMVLGVILLVLAVWRLWSWRRGEKLRGTTTLPPLVTGWITVLTVSVLLMQILNPLIGIVTGWTMAMLPGQGGGSHVVLHRPLWMFSSYFHSALGFCMLLLKVAMVLTGAYTVLRYRAGLIAAFPRAIGWIAFLGMTNSLFALSTFKSYERGPYVVGGFWLLCAAVWGLSRLRRPARTTLPEVERAPIWPAAFAAVLILLGMYGPNAMFRVSPFEAKTTGGPAGVTSHAAPAQMAVLPPETDYERQVRAETFKWCTFCHAMKKGADHMAGPNLYGIYGQKIASVPNFGYGEALKARGAKGQVWDDAALDALLADPDAFAPGTTMIISSGNITDPKRRAALINILKRETGSVAAE